MPNDFLGFDEQLKKKKKSQGLGGVTSVEKSNAMEAGSGMSKDQKLAAAKMSIDAAKSAGLVDTSSTGGGALAGAASGAMAGAAFGAPGAIIGGAVGGITGGLKARSARKKAQKEAEAKMHQGLAQVAENKADRLRQAFSSLGSLMRIQ